MPFEKKKKSTVHRKWNHKLTLNRPMAYLMHSHQMLLFEVHFQCTAIKIAQFKTEVVWKVLSCHQHTTLTG